MGESHLRLEGGQGFLDQSLHPTAHMGFSHLVGGLLRAETSADVPQHLLTVATLRYD